MSLLVVGVSHRSAPLHIVERATVPREGVAGLLRAVQAAEPVSEALLLSSCNRVEVYAEVNRFHAAVTEIGRLLAEQVGLELAELADHLYVHYDEPAV
nr:glutamyl-tRNA reductase [Geodermatophilaceae bacterium]